MGGSDSPSSAPSSTATVWFVRCAVSISRCDIVVLACSFLTSRRDCLAGTATTIVWSANIVDSVSVHFPWSCLRRCQARGSSFLFFFSSSRLPKTGGVLYDFSTRKEVTRGPGPVILFRSLVFEFLSHITSLKRWQTVCTNINTGFTSHPNQTSHCGRLWHHRLTAVRWPTLRRWLPRPTNRVLQR